MNDLQTAYHSLVFACELEDLDLIRELVAQSPGLVDFCPPDKPRPTVVCCDNQYLPALAVLLELGAHPSMGDMNKLCPGAVKMLLSHGADPNETDETDWSVLHTACAMGWEEVACLLVEAGADINRVDRDKWSALDVCIQKQTPDLPHRLTSLVQAADLSRLPAPCLSKRRPRRV